MLEATEENKFVLKKDDGFRDRRLIRPVAQLSNVTVGMVVNRKRNTRRAARGRCAVNPSRSPADKTSPSRVLAAKREASSPPGRAARLPVAGCSNGIGITREAG